MILYVFISWFKTFDQHLKIRKHTWTSATLSKHCCPVISLVNCHSGKIYKCLSIYLLSIPISPSPFPSFFPTPSSSHFPFLSLSHLLSLRVLMGRQDLFLKEIFRKHRKNIQSTKEEGRKGESYISSPFLRLQFYSISLSKLSDFVQ